MRYSILKLSLSALVMMLPLTNVNADTLKNNANEAQPVKSKFVPFVDKTNLHVLFDNSQAALQNLIFDVKKDVGSNLSKNIHIFYASKSHYQSAVDIQRVLLKSGVKRNHINLRQVNNASYPLYVEVQEITGQKYNCKYGIAEHVLHRQYQPCAINSNNKIHLKN